jgi:hypothetical protein
MKKTVLLCTAILFALIPLALAEVLESNYIIDAREKPIEVTPSSPLEIPFSLVSVPRKAKLKISFLVDSKGRCPKTYEPTAISINKNRVEEIDFLRNYMKGEMVVHIILLPSEALKIGENLIRIDMGSCQHGKDKMRLYYILLQVEP